MKEDKICRDVALEKERRSAKKAKREPNFSSIYEKFPNYPIEPVVNGGVVTCQVIAPQTVEDRTNSIEGDLNEKEFNDSGERGSARSASREPDASSMVEKFPKYQIDPMANGDVVTCQIISPGAVEDKSGSIYDNLNGKGSADSGKTEKIITESVMNDEDVTVSTFGNYQEADLNEELENVEGEKPDIEKYCTVIEEDKANSYSVSDDGDVDIVFDDSNDGKVTEREKREQEPYYYMCKFHDFEDYKRMRSEYEMYTSEEALAQCLHRYDTQKNESLNIVIAKYAPKNRHYSKSVALLTRVYVAVGVSLVRKQMYWSEVCKELGFNSGKIMDEILGSDDKVYHSRRERAMSLTGKRMRQKTNYERIKRLKTEEGSDRKKKLAMYKAGAGVGLGGTEKKKTGRQQNVTRGTGELGKSKKGKYCKYRLICREGHETAKNKACIMNGKRDKNFLALVNNKILKKKLLSDEDRQVFENVVGDNLVYQKYVERIQGEMETVKT